MTKQEIIEHLNVFVDQIITQHKQQCFSRYVASKKVSFVETKISFQPDYTFIYGKTLTGNNVKIFDRMSPRHPQKIECSCADYDKRMKFKGMNGKPCKHIFALIDKYQSKRSEITNTIKGE
jgi:hypothetical protein